MTLDRGQLAKEVKHIGASYIRPDSYFAQNKCACPSADEHRCSDNSRSNLSVRQMMILEAARSTKPKSVVCPCNPNTPNSQVYSSALGAAVSKSFARAFWSVDAVASFSGYAWLVVVRWHFPDERGIGHFMAVPSIMHHKILVSWLRPWFKYLIW